MARGRGRLQAEDNRNDRGRPGAQQDEPATPGDHGPRASGTSWQGSRVPGAGRLRAFGSSP